MKESFFSMFTFSFLLMCILCNSASASDLTGSVPEPNISSLTTQVNEDILRGPFARVDEARKRAIDFECPAYFPSEWDAVEAQYAATAVMPNSNQNETQVSVFYTAADAYDDLFGKTIPLYAQAREDEIISARDELISTGFARFFPKYLRNMDQKALAALAQYEAGDYYKAKDTAAEALNEYETMIIGAEIFSTRQEIVDRGFTKYDFDNFDKADVLAQAAINEYEAGNKLSAVTAAEESLLHFNIVLTNGWTTYAAERQDSAVVEPD